MKTLQSLFFACLIAISAFSSVVYADGDVVNINTADAKALATTLKGVGEKKAQAIVDYREQFGAFKAVEELAEVKGIGMATVEDNRRVISLQ